MFNAAYKKEALDTLSKVGRHYENVYEITVKNITELHKLRLTSIKVLKFLEQYISTLANRPKEYDKTICEIEIRRKKFESDLNMLEIESRKTDNISNGMAGAGVLAGAGVAALGPSAAMAIAMTFGTASTGTAIATLSGAAATNAALAWLGGGTLLAGGAGVAGGEALLALAGPIGWAIGGAALLGGGILASSKNKKIAEKAESSIRKLKKEIERILESNTRVCALHETTSLLNYELSHGIQAIFNTKLENYDLFTEENKNQLRSIMNSAEALSKKIGEIVT